VLRRASESDRETLRRWRNHPDVRAVSTYRHEITPNEHAAWWSRIQDDPGTRVLVFEHEGVPAGAVTMSGHDPVTGTASWGFYLDLEGLEARGGALSAWMAVQRDAIVYAFGEMDLAELTAEVLEHNTVVRRMNRRFGFVEGEPETCERDGRTLRIIPIRLRREDRRDHRPVSA